jgi:CBS domain-containing protein
VKETIREIMTPDPIALDASSNVRDAARAMRDEGIGDILVTDRGRVREATRLMREHAVRRLPVIEDGRAVGIVSLGDIAVARDHESVLGRISAAPAQD